MNNKQRPTSLLHESDDWDEIPLEDLIAESEETDITFTDRRKPKRAISMRVDPDLIAFAKKIAGQWDIGYQTLFRIWLLQGANRYRSRLRASAISGLKKKASARKE